MHITTIGLDLAKSVFQVHCVDATGQVVVNKAIRRGQVLAFFAKLDPCLVGMEACATAHHWARELIKLGHEVRLIPPAYVKPYVRRGKNDAADAAAICEAVGRPSMRFVPVKPVENQAALMAHRSRDLLIGQRTRLINALRAHLAELGLVAAQGREGLAKLIGFVAAEGGEALPPNARAALIPLVRQLQSLQQEIGALDKIIQVQHRASKESMRLATIPGIGPLIATAITATVTDPSAFKSGRDLAAWIGLVPRQNSSGGKARLGGISKQGDRYLRKLLVVGASAVVRQARSNPGKYPWIAQLLARRPAKVVAVALANRTARIAWAVLARGETYRAPECSASPAGGSAMGA
ncbi:MAG: IS110 family transposase [Alphaproteobacteria bacterium]|nr:IS110 family transposase [Alphaproteobacteria bacterium]